MFKDQVPYKIGDVVYMEYSCIKSVHKVIVRKVNEYRTLFGKKRYKYLVENASNLNRDDYTIIYHEDIKFEE